MFKNKILLITGGTGSFGNAITHRFLSTDIKEIRIFSRDEKKQEDMRLSFSNPKIKYIIGDVRNYESILSASNNVDYIFHAAALKQVPSCEFFPMEAVETNIIGTNNVIRAASTSNVKKLIVLSTDKAVYPINAMGISKAMSEKIVLSQALNINQHKLVVCATRYGNVIGSRGSVIPLFINQIKNNKNLTITDPKMTRFLMSLEESVDLVLYAFKKSKNGDIFVQKSPAATIENIAKAIKTIFQYTKKNIIIGTRHSEKKFETLISKEEMSRASSAKKYFKIPSDKRDLNYNKYFNLGSDIHKFEDYNSTNTQILSVDEIIKLLMKTPSFRTLI